MGPLPAGRLAISRNHVVELAAQTLNWRRYPGGYWMLTHDVAEHLGVSRQWIDQLVHQGRLPAVRHVDRVWLFRRGQLLTIANARAARWR